MEGGPSIQENENLNSESTESSEENNESESIGCVHSCCDPRGKMHRFVALLFVCFLGFGKFTG